MQITNSVVCDTCKGSVYKQMKPYLVGLGGTLKFLSRLVLKFNTTFFRKDKWGIILKEIIRTFKIRVLWGFKVGPISRKRGR